MRTLILALAVVLLAAPAWATVEIIVTDTDGTGPGKIAEISYDATGETELPMTTPSVTTTADSASSRAALPQTSR